MKQISFEMDWEDNRLDVPGTTTSHSCVLHCLPNAAQRSASTRGFVVTGRAYVLRPDGRTLYQSMADIEREGSTFGKNSDTF